MFIIIFKLVIPSLSSLNKIDNDVEEISKRAEIFNLKVQRSINQHFENENENKLNELKSKIKDLREGLHNDYHKLEYISNEINKCNIVIESSSALIKILDKNLEVNKVSKSNFNKYIINKLKKINKKYDEQSIFNKCSNFVFKPIEESKFSLFI